MSTLRDILAEELPELKEDLGDLVTYTHKPGNTVQSVTGIIADSVPESNFPGKNLQMKFFLADLSPAPIQGDLVTYSGTTYTATDVKTRNGVIAFVSLRKNA
jgi:hypothetical protein